MPYPLPLTRTEAYLAYKAGVIQQSDLKPSLAVPRNGIDAWLAYWTGLAADYPKREDGTPHILQEEEAYIAYLCGVINEYPEKCLRRVGAYLRYLISARWGRPDHPLNREELYLSLIKTQVIPSGDPSSDIVIDGTAKAPFQDVKMYGDTEQQSYTGKNLLRIVPIGTAQGVKGTVNQDGTVTASGTCTATYVNLTSRSTVISFPAGTYTLSTTTTHSKFGVVLRLYTQETGGSYIADYAVSKNETSKTFTVSSDIKSGYIWFSGTSDGLEIDETMGIQLEAGSTPTSFEPFVGGQFSPSPEYPQPVQTVTGEQTITVVGKNIIDYITGLISSGGGITNTINSDGTITTAGKPNADYRNIIGYYDLTPYLEDGATYWLSSTLYDNKTAAQVRRTKISDSSTYNYDTLAGAKTFTVDKSQYRYRMGILTNTMTAWGDESLTITKGYQLEKSASSTAFAPYHATSYPINLGKNLFDNTGWEQGQYSDGVWGAGNTKRATSGFIPIVGGTYTISLNSTDNRTAFINLNYFDGAKTWLGNRTTLGLEAFGVTDRVKTFTLPNNASYLRVTVRPYGGDDQGDNIIQYAPSEKLQVEVGSTVTTYAPYFAPIELCKLDTYQDYIYKDGNDWKVHKAIGSASFDASSDENWIRSGQSTSAVFVAALSNLRSGGFVNSAVSTVGLLNSFEFNATNTNIINKARFNRNQGSGYNDYLLLGLDPTVWTSIDQVKTWLASNNLTLYYIRVTPIDTTITNQALIDQLEALIDGGAENGTTYIKVNATDPNLPGLLYVEAPKYE